METLRGITWDHPRGYQPLRAIAARWQTIGNAEVKWYIRSLKEFGDCPIETLINTNDLIILDHPYVGNAASGKLLLPLERYLSPAFLDIQRQESIGEAFESYWYDNHCWALPIDAAAQVTAYRKDLTDAIGWKLPEETLRLNEAAMELPAKYKVGIPLCPTDAWCVFLTLCAQYSNGQVFTESGVGTEAGEWAIGQIRQWRTFLHPFSYDMNPVEMLEFMSREDEILYVPFIFGYTNYARKGWGKKLIHFGNVPRYDVKGISSLMGGAGLAISAKSAHIKECVDFIQFILSVDVQKGLYYNNGGQPAHLSAWMDEENNRDCSGFFSDTLDTMKQAFVRPRHAGFNSFQEKAASLIHECLRDHSPGKQAIDKLNNLYQSICHETI